MGVQAWVQWVASRVWEGLGALGDASVHHVSSAHPRGQMQQPRAFHGTLQGRAAVLVVVLVEAVVLVATAASKVASMARVACSMLKYADEDGSTAARPEKYLQTVQSRGRSMRSSAWGRAALCRPRAPPAALTSSPQELGSLAYFCRSMSACGQKQPRCVRMGGQEQLRACVLKAESVGPSFRW